MRKIKKTDISIMNVFAGIGIACVLLGSVMLFSYLAIVRDENGQYALTLLGSKVPVSPSSKKVTSAPASPSGTGESACGLKKELTWNGANPSGIAFDRDGNIYIVDKGTGKIKVFDKDGEKEITFNLNQTLKEPEGIVIHYDKDNKLFVYVADTGNGRIAKFDSTGAFVKEWKNIPGGGDFAPTHMTYYIDYNGYPPVSYIAVLNKKNNTTILKLELNDTKDLELFTATGNLPTNPITSIATSYLDYDKNGPVQFLYASSKAPDNSVNEVYKYYLYTGAPATPAKWGKTGPKDGEFDAIGEIAVLGWQRTQLVFAPDTTKGVIYEFDGDGNLRSVFRGQTGGGDNYKGVLSVFRMQWKDPATGGLLTNENLYGITKNGVRIFGTNCAKLTIVKDFVPGTDPRDFEFNITVDPKSDVPSNYTSGKFTLNDDKNISTSYNVPKSAVANKFIKYLITETPITNVDVSWECDWGSGKHTYTPSTSDIPNVAWLHVATGTEKSTCTFTNSTTPPDAKIVVIKKTDPTPNPQDFEFTLSLAGAPDQKFYLDDDDDPTLSNKSKEHDAVGGKIYNIKEKEVIPPYPNSKYEVYYECHYFYIKDTKEHEAGLPVDNGQGGLKWSYGYSNSANINPGINEKAVCTFTNKIVFTKNSGNGTLVVKKIVDPKEKIDIFKFELEGENGRWKFDLKDDGSGNNIWSRPGSDQNQTYELEEDYVSDYYITSISCVNSQNKIVGSSSPNYRSGRNVKFKFPNPNSGPDTVTCTVTNKKLGEIIVVKNTEPKPDFTDFKFDLKGGEVHKEFLLDDEPGKLVQTNPLIPHYEEVDTIPKSKSSLLFPGKYNIQEFFDKRYETSYICVSSIKGKAPISGKGGNIKEIVLAGGEKLTCTFTNKKCAKGALCGVDTTTLPKGGTGGTP